MNKRIQALMISMFVLASAASGCGNAATTTATTAGTTAAATEATTAAATEAASADVPELIWIMGNPGKVPVDQAAVEAKLNEISVPAVGAKVKTLYYDNDKTLLALSSGEDFDMVFTCEWFNNYAVQAQAGYFADITDKVQTLTPDLYATMPEVVWEGAKIAGKIYAIPVKKDYAAEVYWRLDKDLFVDDLGMTVPDSMSFSDIEPFLKAAKEANAKGDAKAANAQYPLMMNKDSIGGIDAGYDMINRDAMMGIPYYAVGTADENKVQLIYEDKELVERLNLMHKWFEAGYINPDATTIQDIGKYSAVKSGQGFYGADAIWTSGDGYTQVISKFSGPYLSTSSIRGSMNAINANSENIDLALKFQQLVNTNQEYRDILRYGIEGTHWNKVDGLAMKTQAGRDNYGVWAFSQGSYSLSTVEGSDTVKVDPEMWTKIFEGYKDLKATNSIGFAFDISNVDVQVAACKAIQDKYKSGLYTGTSDPNEVLPKMIKELEAAGIRDIQTECQKQYDAFVASK